MTIWGITNHLNQCLHSLTYNHYHHRWNLNHLGDSLHLLQSQALFFVSFLVVLSQNVQEEVWRLTFMLMKTSKFFWPTHFRQYRIHLKPKHFAWPTHLFDHLISNSLVQQCRTLSVILLLHQHTIAKSAKHENARQTLKTLETSWRVERLLNEL